jgi:hypothetical protein
MKVAELTDIIHRAAVLLCCTWNEAQEIVRFYNIRIAHEVRPHGHNVCCAGLSPRSIESWCICHIGTATCITIVDCKVTSRARPDVPSYTSGIAQIAAGERVDGVTTKDFRNFVIALSTTVVQ